MYQPISVIEYRGRVTGSSRSGSRADSRGHYTCDVKDISTNSWYRTNDNAIPLEIPVSDVSKQGYVILYKII